ncbi:MAG: hypothetical protein AB1299_04345 [Thermoproteota archaeon]
MDKARKPQRTSAKLTGLDTQKFNEHLDSGKYENRMKENKNLAMKSGRSQRQLSS